MSLTSSVTIRISAEKRFLYEAEAAHQGQSLGVYLRKLLEKSESSAQELQNIHDLLKNLTSSSSSHDQGILLELLLLIRCIVGPEKINLVRRELRRLNIPLWQGESFFKE